MNILMFGPNGSGKGTQGTLVKAKFDLDHIESGARLGRYVELAEEVVEVVDDMFALMRCSVRDALAAKLLLGAHKQFQLQGALVLYFQHKHMRSAFAHMFALHVGKQGFRQRQVEDAVEGAGKAHVRQARQHLLQVLWVEILNEVTAHHVFLLLGGIIEPAFCVLSTAFAIQRFVILASPAIQVGVRVHGVAVQIEDAPCDVDETIG